MDHLCAAFTCRRQTNRWPMALFFNMVDVSGVASVLIWLSLNPNWQGQNPQCSRIIFLQQLAHGLVEENNSYPTTKPTDPETQCKTCIENAGKA